MSKKRAKQNSEYSVKRIAFLAKHPYCQAFLAFAGLKESDIDEEGCVFNGASHMFVPASEEIHHLDGREGESLNDDTKWLAVSRRFHQAIHEHPANARKLGLLV